MPAHTFQLAALLRTLEPDVHLAEALLYPEFSRLGEDADELVEAMIDNAGRFLKQLDAGELYRRRGPTEVTSGTLRLELQPPRSPAWREPLTLVLPVVRWRHEDAHLALLPSLGIEVVAGSEDELAAMLPTHARIAVLRAQALRLDRLAWLARGGRLDVRSVEVTVERPTPKQAALAEREEHDRQESVLDKVGTRIDQLGLPPAFEVDESLALVAEILAGRHPRSVLLIGPSGVGKTALVHELVRRRDHLGLGGRPFWATSGARLVAGQSGFGMWQERCKQLWREASKRQAILHLGNLMELLDVGKSEHQAQGLATFLRPWLARGDLLAILECTPEQLPLIERQDPHLVRALAPVRLKEPDDARLESILRQFAAEQFRTPLTLAGLGEVLRLHRRYAAYSANPGRPLRFLRNLITDQPHRAPIDVATVTTAFSKETGLPLVLLEDSVRLDLDEARRWFASRVIGQSDAVDLVVDLLATVKAALNRPRKPIASLLFIGPTGVGKTEMAKALAEYLFDSRDRLTRFDMSEYSDPLSVQRLIGGVLGNEGVLTAKVREQPFSVVLLDEVEKAHPQMFDLLLQVLGEGRLTDAAGRLADFCNSVVIMTSNLGAESYLQGDFGLVAGQPTARRAREHFTREVEKSLRPELFNRIDRIVAFAPLDEATTRLIADRQIALLQVRDGVRYRGVAMEVADDLTAWLAQKGHDPRYGARPLKRTIERHLLAPLSAQMNAYTADTPLRVRLGVENDAPTVHVRARTDDAGQQVAVSGLGPKQVQQASRAVELRRWWQRLVACSSMLEVNNEIYRIEKAQKRHSHYDPQLASLTKLRDDVQTAVDDAIRREDEVLARFYAREGDAAELDELRRQLDEGSARFDELLLSLFLRRFTQPDRVSLAVFSEDQDTLFEFALAYHRVATGTGFRVSVWQLVVDDGLRLRQVVQTGDAFGSKPVIAVHVWDAKQRAFLAEVVNVSATRGIIGVGLDLQGPAASPRLLPEQGLHVFQSARRTSKALVVTGVEPITSLPLPEGVERKGTIGAQPRRRLYRLDQDIVEDDRVGWVSAPGGSLETALSTCVATTLRKAAREVLES